MMVGGHWAVGGTAPVNGPFSYTVVSGLSERDFSRFGS